MKLLNLEFFNKPTVEVAKSLLGHNLILKNNNIIIGGIINEVEAYTQDDSASHSYKGLTKRNKPMFNDPGTIYIYQIYGMYYCLNISTEKKNQGCAVLIRSLIPTHGLDVIKKNRKDKTQLTNGPAKLVQALNIPINLNGTLINKKNLLISSEKITPNNIITSNRIGISKNKNKQWRFYFNC